MRRSFLFAALLLTTMWAAPAAAQDAPRVGVAMGYPGSIGILWRVADRLAIRPQAMFQTDRDRSDSSSFSSSGTLVSVGASALFYLTEREGLRPYLAPRFSYGRNSLTTHTTSPSGGSTSHDDSYLLAGSFGAEYALGRRFSLFGEFGLAYTYITSSLQVSGSTSSGPSGTGKRFATSTAVGVVVWF